MFTTLIVQPIFNLLVLIFALLPGHNLGLAIIIFTIVVRLLMWPLVKKQLHQTKAMRQLQPEIKRIKQAAKGNKQQESVMLMALYKERGINPFSSIGIVLVQLPILLGLYSGLSRLIHDHQRIVDFSYPILRDFSWMKQLAADISLFDNTLLGVVDLGRKALENGVIYWPAMLIAAGSAFAQYYQSKQLMPSDKNARSLRQLLREAGEGKAADSGETNAAVGRSMRYFIPAMVLVISLNLPAALPLYWLTGGIIAVIQQSRVLRQDETEMEAIADTKAGSVIEGEVVAATRATKTKPKKGKTTSKKAKKRRK